MKNRCWVQSGLSLIEVLVSVVILAVGMLGIAGLQLTMIRDNHSSYLRSIAIAQTSNMLDRMRGNYEGVNAGYYNSISGTPTNPNCSPCSNAQLALLDAHEWNSMNAQLLPAGVGSVQKNGNQFTISVCWNDNAENEQTCFVREVEL